METTVNAMQIIGFFSILAGITFLLVRLVQTIVFKRRSQIRYGVEAAIVLSIVYYTSAHGLAWIGYSALESSLKNIIAFLWWVNLAFILDTSIRVYAWDGVLAEGGRRRVPQIVTGGMSLFLYTSAIVIVLHFFYQQSIGALLATSGAAALVVGFSAQSVLKEIFSGLALNMTRAIRMGDFIEIDGIYGEVFDINWRSISVKNPNTNSLYVFPNSAVSEKTILNFSEPDGRFKWFIHFHVEASSPPEKVVRVIAEELKHSRYVLRDPAPDFNMLGYGELGLEIRMRFFFTGDDPWWDAQNEACMAIWEAMRKHNLRLGIKRFQMKSDFEWPMIKNELMRKFDTQTLQTRLRQSTVFNALDVQQLAHIIELSQVVDLHPPSCFYLQDEVITSGYLVLEGCVDILMTTEAEEVLIDKCYPGEIFGFSELFEGGRRKNIAQADEYSIVLMIPLDRLAEQLQQQGAMKERIEQHIEAKNKKRNLALQQSIAELKSKKINKSKHLLLNEMKHSIDHLLHDSWWRHFVSHLSPSMRHKELLDSTMAACALVYCADNQSERVKLDLIHDVLQRSGLDRHIAANEAASSFKKYVHDLDASTVSKNELLKKISLVKNSEKLAHIVMVVAIAVKSSTTQSEKEHITVSQIADILGLDEDHELLIEKLRNTSRKRL